MTKEEFNKVWKDTSRKGILNQYYYDYCYMQKLKKDINKAIEYMEMELGYNKEGVFKAFGDLDYAQEEVENLYRILKGGEDNR